MSSGEDTTLRDLQDLSKPLRDAGVIPAEVSVVTWTEPDGTICTHGGVRFDVRQSTHRDLNILPTFAGTAIRAQVAKRVGGDLMASIANWIPVRYLRRRQEVRDLENTIRDLVHVLEHVEDVHPLIQPSQRNLAAQRGRQALISIETKDGPPVCVDCGALTEMVGSTMCQTCKERRGLIGGPAAAR